MDYDTKLWNQYTDDNENSDQIELSKFIYHSSLVLGSKNICEAGCNVGNNLSAFPNDFKIHGIDVNEYALRKAKTKYPNFTFSHENLKKISLSESSFDLVFTRGVLVHVPDEEVDDVLKEILRISGKWVFNLEYFGEDGKIIKWKRGDDLLWYRDMKKRWSKFNVEIITDVEIPHHIDSGKTHFTLIKKI